MPQDQPDLKAVNFLRLLWCNGAGLRCCRVVPLPKKNKHEHLKKLATEGGPGLTKACMALPAWGDVPAQKDGIVGDVLLLPDSTTVRLIPWHPTHAFVHVSMHDPATKTNWAQCPRSSLQRILTLAEAKHGLSVQAGYEVEFALFKDGQPIDNRTYSSAGKFDRAAGFLDDLSNALDLLGLDVQQLHAESGPGQYEVVLGHRTALEAADGVLLAREAIPAVASRHGLQASFLPKYSQDNAGNGQHVHLSIWRDGVNLFATSDQQTPPSASELRIGNPTLRNFIAGVLSHLPSLLCFCAPTPNSFRRSQPGRWAGAFQAWGFGNKEAGLRVPVRGNTLSNFEVKVVDATCNPHIALAALIAAGMVGIEEGLDLPPPLQVDPGSLDAAEVAERQIAPLPSDFATARRSLLEKHPALVELVGRELVKALLAVRESETSIIGKMTFEKELRLLLDRY